MSVLLNFSCNSSLTKIRHIQLLAKRISIILCGRSHTELPPLSCYVLVIIISNAAGSSPAGLLKKLCVISCINILKESLVTVRPIIDKLPFKTKTLRTGNSIELKCDVHYGNPTPRTRWEFIATDSSVTVLSR